MGIVGELFPGRKITDEAGEAGSGQRWRLGPIDLDRGVVEVRRATAPPGAPGTPVELPPAAEPAAG